MREPVQPGVQQVPVVSTPPPPYPGQRRAESQQPQQTGPAVCRGDPPTYANLPPGPADGSAGRSGLLPYQVTPPKSQVRAVPLRRGGGGCAWVAGLWSGSMSAAAVGQAAD